MYQWALSQICGSGSSARGCTAQTRFLRLVLTWCKYHFLYFIYWSHPIIKPSCHLDWGHSHPERARFHEDGDVSPWNAGDQSKELGIDLQWLFSLRGKVDTKHTGTRQRVSEEWFVSPYHCFRISLGQRLQLDFFHSTLKCICLCNKDFITFLLYIGAVHLDSLFDHWPSSVTWRTLALHLR